MLHGDCSLWECRGLRAVSQPQVISTAAGNVDAAQILSYGQVSFAYAQVTDFYITRTARLQSPLIRAMDTSSVVMKSSTEMEWLSSSTLVMNRRSALVISLSTA